MKKHKGGSNILGRAFALVLTLILTISVFPPLHSEAASDSAKESFKQEVIKMLSTADKTTHDVSKYNLSASDIGNIFRSIKNSDESKWRVAAYYSNLYLDYTVSDGKVSSVNLVNVDADALSRYSRLYENVQKIKAGIEPKMDNLDKIIYLHDSIVELATYKYVAYQSYGACGILGDKTGVCAGYTKALNLLLDDQAILSVYMSSDAIDHGWNAIYLDGKWYHMDSTWDDTRSSKAGETSHRFLLRNDKEFVTNDSNSHVSWKPYNYSGSIVSDSGRFTDWYVHDVVGKMAFEDGYWYYVDTNTNSIMENTSEGGHARVVLDGTGKSQITLIDATSNGITYKEGSTQKTIGYVAEKSADEVVTQPVVKDTVKAGIEATIYLNRETDASYKQAGTATLKDGTTSKNISTVTGKIVKLPDLSKYVSEKEYVKWTAITKSGSGRLFLKGTICKAAESNSSDKTDSTSALTEKSVSATFYVKRAGESSYTSIGTGYLSKAETGTNSEKIAANIAIAPNTSSILKAGEKIVWTKVSKSSSGKYSVKGEIK